MNEFKGTTGKLFIISNSKSQYAIVDNERAMCFIPKLHPQAKENSNLICAAPDLLAACMEFVRKCECGEARSKRSYAQMKEAVNKALGNDTNT